MAPDSKESKARGTEQGRMNTVTCFPLQPFVLTVMSLNSEFFKAGQLGSGIAPPQKKKFFQSVFPPGKDLYLWALGDGDSDG